MALFRRLEIGVFGSLAYPSLQTLRKTRIPSLEVQSTTFVLTAVVEPGIFPPWLSSLHAGIIGVHHPVYLTSFELAKRNCHQIPAFASSICIVQAQARWPCYLPHLRFQVQSPGTIWWREPTSRLFSDLPPAHVFTHKCTHAHICTIK